MNPFKKTAIILLSMILALLTMSVKASHIEACSGVRIEGSPVVLDPDYLIPVFGNWIKSSDDIILRISLKNTGCETIEDVTMTLVAPTDVSINIVEDTYNYGDLEPNISVPGFFRITTTNTPVGEHILRLNGRNIIVVVSSFTFEDENHLSTTFMLGTIHQVIVERYPDTDFMTKAISTFYPDKPFTGIHPPHHCAFDWGRFGRKAAIGTLTAAGGVLMCGTGWGCVVGASLIGVAAEIAYGCPEDVFWQGEDNTIPTTADEITLSETVEMSITYPAKPETGKSLRIDVDWTFERITNITTYTYSKSETKTSKAKTFDSYLEDAVAVEAGADQTVVKGSEVFFAGKFLDPGWLHTPTIEWDFGDGSTASGMFTPSHNYADSGVYTVTLIISDGYDDVVSTDSDTLTVTVLEASESISGDLDGDGDVDYGDYLLFRTAYGSCEGDANYMSGADLDGDNCVSINDYRILRTL
jgi:PKD repeat protein